jgi:hypothetical protein
MAGIDAEDLDEFAEIVAQKLLGNRRAIKVNEQRVNVKPRRPVGYTYAYLETLVGSGLSGKEWDLVFTLAARADTHGLIVYSAAEIAGELGMENSQLHKGLRHIQTAGIMEKVGRGALRLNPRKMWHGSSATQVKLLGETIAAELRASYREEGWIEN